MKSKPNVLKNVNAEKPESKGMEKKRSSSLESYELVVDNVPAKINIMSIHKEFVPVYQVIFPKIEPATQAVLDEIRERLISEMDIKPIEVLNPEEIKALKTDFIEKSLTLIGRELPHLSKKNQEVLAGILMHKSLGLGAIELMLQDKNLEEIVINNSKEVIWVYHRTRGWLKSNIMLGSENEIYNYSALIGRRVGTQITHLNPLMDAYLTTGDRANATLFPVSSKGNTLTIRKFARKPWTITDFIKNKTISADMAAFLWLTIQYELNALISGGTASGKTSFLNALSCFIPPNHRVISIEDTREIQLPRYLHWVPLTTRPPNPEGKGEVTMLELIINALRMRPDRVIVGEIRRAKEAEVLFEAIHTGHSVYSTLHANTAEETYRRLTNPPIDIPTSLLGSLHLIVVMHRDRRREIRRVLEISELMGEEGAEYRLELNTIFRWLPSKDKIIRLSKSVRAMDDIKLFTGMGDKDIENNLNEKKMILDWMVKNNINEINKVGRIVSEYYTNTESVLKKIKK